MLPVGTVTFVFTDIEGSTLLVDRLGDAYASVRADHADLLREAFAAGQVVSAEGDAFGGTCMSSASGSARRPSCPPGGRGPRSRLMRS